MNRTDTFTRADNASAIGSPSDGGSAWQVTGTWGISGNAAYNSGGDSPGLAWLEANTANIDLSVPIENGELRQGIAFRVADASNFLFVFNDPDDPRVRLYSRVAGSDTLLGSYMPPSGPGFPGALTLRVVADGTSLKVYLDSDLRIDVTSSTHQANTKHGLYSFGAVNQRFSSFNLTDLTAASSTAGNRRSLLGIG